jgi:endonuclease/exonuclease/phosphatase family metal-dependent hydrolase
MKSRRRRFAAIAFRTSCALAIISLAVPLLTQGHEETTPKVFNNPDVADQVEQPAEGEEMSLKLISLNIAHGRKDGRHQAFRKKATIRTHLDEIAEVLSREKPHLVALQEADGPSVWSGNFNHVEHLAKEAQFAHCFRGEHVGGMKLSYGTAILSQLPVSRPKSVTFDPSPPTLTKGFVVGTVTWPGREDFKVDVVSVHFDFSRKSVRAKQVKQMVERLSRRKRSLIIMGDFNCQWDGKDPALGTLVEKLDLKCYKPKSETLNTFPKLDKRLDWVLISKDLQFSRYTNLDDVLSDHSAVLAEVRIAPKKDDTQKKRQDKAHSP